MQFALIFIFIAAAIATPEMWIHGCQPNIKDTVMSTHVVDDKDHNKCNLTLTGDSLIPLKEINTSLTYRISFRPTFGQVQIHCLLSATSGELGLGTGYGRKDKCADDGMTGILWRGIADPYGTEEIPFLFTPRVGKPDIKFQVTCSEGIGHPVYQHMLLIGNYTLPKETEITTGPGLAILVLLAMVLPLTGVTTYCLWTKVLREKLFGSKLAPSIGKDEDEEDEEERIEEEKPKKKKQQKEKYQSLEDED